MQTTICNSDQQSCNVTFHCSCKGNSNPQHLTVSGVGVHQSDPPQRFIRCPHCASLLYECPHCQTFVHTSQGETYAQICQVCQEPWEEVGSGGLLNA